MPEITVEHLLKRFGDTVALHDVSLTVRDGEFLTLLGPSGCGKTTTLMSIGGFAQPDRGRITCGERTFLDVDANVNLAPEQRDLGIVFQSYAVWPHMTVAQNVAFPLKVRKVKRADVARRVAETLDLVEMAGYDKRYPHELSGGQRQRVALARALVYSPQVLLLDEPFSNLDAKLRERARVWVKRLQSELALTTIFVTHDQDEALSMSDRILVMEAGKVLQQGTPEEIYHSPTSRFVAEFLGQCNIFTAHAMDANAGTQPCVWVEGLDQRLELSADVRLPAEGSLNLMLRPEAVTLSENGHRGPSNNFPATIRAVTFLGDHYVYELGVGDMTLTATSGRLLQGPSVTAHIPPAACQVMRS